MAESLVHLGLVEAILTYVEQEYRAAYQLAVFHDMPAKIGAEKPPRIDGFVPDVYAENAPRTIMILGEAKTTVDLDTVRSRRQLTAFLTFLSFQSCGVLILAVPIQAKPRAKNLLRNLREQIQCTSVQAVVITG